MSEIELKPCPFKTGALECLEKHQGQLDMDGVDVAVSREALTYVIEWCKENEQLQAKLDKAIEALEVGKAMFDEGVPESEWDSIKTQIREALAEIKRNSQC